MSEIGSDHDGTPPRLSDEEALDYLAVRLPELLAVTTGRPRLRTIRYLLDMARLEIAQTIKASGPRQRR